MKRSMKKKQEPGSRQTFLIEVTRAEFLTLPMPVRRRSLRKQADVFLRLEKKQRLAKQAMDALALELTNNGHTWTRKERRLYEVGIRAVS